MKSLDPALKRFLKYIFSTISILLFVSWPLSETLAETSLSTNNLNATSETPIASATQPAIPDNSKNQTLVTARNMASDQNTGVVTATGHVEIARGDYLLHADKVTYNQKTGVMHAEGHVSILDPSGQVEFADSEEITGDMRQAFAENVGILFPDNSRFAADTAQRYGARYLVATNGIYTACNVCKEDPNNSPLWQLKGQTVVQDNVEHEIYYHDATIELADVPVFYTPYFSTPDPTVERRQGFLAPTPGITPNLGAFVKVPYYFDIAPDKDATFIPTFSTEDKLQLGGEYRERLEHGNIQFDGSFTHTDLVSDAGIDEGQQWRGDLFGNFLYNIDNVWRAGTDVAFVSDKSYLQRYNISSADELTNRAYLEGFSGRNYAAINSYYFEDLRAGDQPVQPLVLPKASFNLMGEPGQTWGGRWNFDGSVLDTVRDNSNENIDQQGPDTRRLSLDAGWERQFISDTGLVTTLSGLIRGDSYSADNVINPDGSGQNYDNVFLNRQFEQANVVARYPIARNGDGYQQLLEPIIALTGAPDVKTSPRQPIEESADVEFDETNLFSPNRFTGTDLIEGGSRATYGLRHTITTDDGQRVDFFGGESYDFSKNAAFPDQSGLENHSSDYVGRFDFIPSDWFNANYGFRLDHDTLAVQRQDALFTVGRPIFRPYGRYLEAYQTETTGVVDLAKEVAIGFESHFAKYWLVGASHTQEFSPEPGPRGTNLTLSYTDECFIFGTTINQNDTQRADIASGTSIVFHLFLKNLGGVHTDSASTGNFAPQFRDY